MTWQGSIAPVGASADASWQQNGQWSKGYGKGKGKGKGKDWGAQPKGKGKGKNNWWPQEYTKRFDLEAAIKAALDKHLGAAPAATVVKPNLGQVPAEGDRYCLTCGMAHNNPEKTNCRNRECNGVVPLHGQDHATLRQPGLPSKGSKQYQALIANKYADLWVDEENDKEEGADVANSSSDPPDQSMKASEEEEAEKQEDKDETKDAIAEVKERIRIFKRWPKKYPESKVKAAEAELKALQPQTKQSESTLQKEMWVLKQQQEQMRKTTTSSRKNWNRICKKARSRWRHCERRWRPK